MRHRPRAASAFGGAFFISRISGRQAAGAEAAAAGLESGGDSALPAADFSILLRASRCATAFGRAEVAFAFSSQA
jgi:hypothetical protein